MAGEGYRLLGGPGKSAPDQNCVIIIGPSHYAGFHGCAVLDRDYIETPLGRVRINREIIARLAENGLFRKDALPFEKEHSVEIHLPFLQRVFREKLSGETQVVPVLVGEISDAEAGRAAAAITAALAGTRPLLIVSTDFTHYGEGFGYRPFPFVDARTTAAALKKLDTGAIESILKKDLPGFSGYCDRTGITICGRNPVKIALALPVDDFGSSLTAYDTSGAMTGDYARSVSYAAIAFTGTLKGAARKEGLTDGERSFLLKAARDNIVSWLDGGGGVRMAMADAPEGARAKRGVFVTLKKRGALRGCIGYTEGIKPLLLAVLDNSYNAAFRDPRFAPLAAGELKDVTIEISVLTGPEAVRSVDEIQVGRDGLIVERGGSRGLLLPQVATEQGWDREIFLDETCRKAGLLPGAWKEADTKILRFGAEVFGEDRR